MALSGTLDTFDLPDVLRLIASSSKTGRLRVSGSRGSGSVWVADGEIVASELTSINALSPSVVDVIFGLLRFETGSFTFEADAVAADAGPGLAMDPILDSAEQMLAEWEAIEEVVSSLETWVGLRPELTGPDVMVDAMRWRCIATVGAGVQVGLIAETLGLSEVDACRLVKELIELGLLTTIDIPAEPSPEPSSDSSSQIAISDSEVDRSAEPHTLGLDPEINPAVVPVAAPAPVPAMEPVTGLITEPLPAPAREPIVAGDEAPAMSSAVPTLAALANLADTNVDRVSTDFGLDPIAMHADALPDIGSMFPAPVPAGVEADDINPAEMARQLASLSPKAAKAVAAAAKATTEAEREAALAAVEAEDGSLDRGLLLKFLGSVSS